MFEYALDSVDHFEGCLSLSDYLDQMREAAARQGGSYDAGRAILPLAMALASPSLRRVWGGDIRTGETIYVFALPPSGQECGMDVGFVWKQDNNGTTFVLSPRRLPWLDEYMIIDTPAQVTIRLKNGGRVGVFGSGSIFIADKIADLIKEAKL